MNEEPMEMSDERMFQDFDVSGIDSGVPEHPRNLEGFRKEDRKRDDQSITTRFENLQH